MTRELFITTEEAAEILGLDPRHVLRLIQAGQLPEARKISTKRTSPFIIPTESVEALAAQRKAIKQKRAHGQKPRAR